MKQKNGSWDDYPKSDNDYGKALLEIMRQFKSKSGTHSSVKEMEREEYVDASVRYYIDEAQREAAVIWAIQHMEGGRDFPDGVEQLNYDHGYESGVRYAERMAAYWGQPLSDAERDKSGHERGQDDVEFADTDSLRKKFEDEWDRHNPKRGWRCLWAWHCG